MPQFSSVLMSERVIDSVCRRHCEIKKWVLHALNVRSNHLHVVVSCDAKPTTVQNQLKSYATRELRKINSEITVDRRIWTRGGDCELIDSQEDLNAVCDYVLLAQDSIRAVSLYV